MRTPEQERRLRNLQRTAASMLRDLYRIALSSGQTGEQFLASVDAAADEQKRDWRDLLLARGIGEDHWLHDAGRMVIDRGIADETTLIAAEIDCGGRT